MDCTAKKMAVEERWPLWRGGCYWRFDCIAVHVLWSTGRKLSYLVVPGRFRPVNNKSNGAFLYVCRCKIALNG